jgi:amidohydrolase
MITAQKVQEIANRIYPEIVEFRRHIHQNPELSFEENQTSEYIAKILDSLNITYRKGFVKTGIVAHIFGRNPLKRTIALRADMDALPIIEANGVDYKSKNVGVMHACGHDAHSASLLGAAIILNELKEEFEGTIKLIFQPAEELLPGGAKLMLEEGALMNPEPDLIIGQHVMPDFKVGTVGFRPGMYMASCDELYMTVTGKGGHAALSHHVTDTVLIASHIIVALQQIVSRNANAAIPTILSFGKVQANGATNIIPNEVHIEGTFRTMNEEWRTNAHEKMIKLAKGIAQSMGGDCDLRIEKGYPCLINDSTATGLAHNFAKEYLGNENVINMDLRMTSEDFAWYTLKYPSLFYRLGVKSDLDEPTKGLHTPTFDIDEKALNYGCGVMAWLAISFLNK